MSVEKFKARFPEFLDTDEKLLSMAISEAQSEMNQKYWGGLFETASFYLAAHKLAISPIGESVRLEGVKEKNVYELEYIRLCRSAYLGASVI